MIAAAGKILFHIWTNVCPLYQLFRFQGFNWLKAAGYRFFVRKGKEDAGEGEKRTKGRTWKKREKREEGASTVQRIGERVFVFGARGEFCCRTVLLLSAHLQHVRDLFRNNLWKPFAIVLSSPQSFYILRLFEAQNMKKRMYRTLVFRDCFSLLVRHTKKCWSFQRKIYYFSLFSQ